MSDAPEKDQKTEAPTAKRRADAARDGDILQSREFSTALVMLAGAAWLAFLGPHFADSCLNLLKVGLSLQNGDVRNFDPVAATYKLIPVIILPLGSLFGITILAAIAGPALLGSAGFRSQAIGFKANKLNPLKGLARIFGTQGLIELGKSLVKAALLGALGYWLVTNDLVMMFGLSASDIKPAVRNMGASISLAFLWLALGLTLIASIDVPVQLIRRNASLRMSKQEVKEEMRQSDGAPEMKQARRQRQHDILAGSARKAVSEATVILTNPTHFAVALRYRPGIDVAPVVAARGRGEVALAIRALAKDQGVTMLEYPQLARAIYFTSRAGHPIAEDLFIAVATILAFVFNIEQALAEGVSQPDISVPQGKHFDTDGKKSVAKET
jgi:flagellar biosynthesis protein FlhB